MPSPISSLPDPALEQALVDIESAHGKGSIMRLGDVPEPVETTSTGSLGLDLALGSGGYPRGRIIEIFGPVDSGRSTLGLHAIAQMQSSGGRCAVIDADHALDPAYARAIGVSLESLLVSQPDNGEQALDIIEMLVRSNCVDMVVVDSVAALAPRDELEGHFADAPMGLQARMMSKAMRKLTGLVSKSTTTVIFINGLREQNSAFYGPYEVTLGGNALKYYASVRLDVRQIGTVKSGETVVGSRTRVKVVKNKLAPPFQQVEFDILFGKGIDRLGEIVDMGLACGTVEVLTIDDAPWLRYGERRWRGRDGMIAALAADDVLRERVRADITSTRRSAT